MWVYVTNNMHDTDTKCNFYLKDFGRTYAMLLLDC